MAMQHFQIELCQNASQHFAKQVNRQTNPVGQIAKDSFVGSERQKNTPTKQTSASDLRRQKTN